MVVAVIGLISRSAVSATRFSEKILLGIGGKADLSLVTKRFEGLSNTQIIIILILMLLNKDSTGVD